MKSLEQRIQERAFEVWQRREREGKAGDSHSDWEQAKKEVMAEEAAAKPAAKPVETKAAPKVEPKAEVKAPPRVEPKIEVKAAPPKVEPKPEIKVAPAVTAAAAPAKKAVVPTKKSTKK